MSLRIGNQHRSKCRGKFGRNDTQFKTAVAKLLNKFGEIGTIKDARQRVYHRSRYSSESEDINSSSGTVIAH